MEYAEFEVEYKQVADVILNGRNGVDLTADIAPARPSETTNTYFTC